jgi:uncharacterized protein
MDVFEAVKKRDLHLLKECSVKGLMNSQNKNGMTPLMIAIDNDDFELIKYILNLKVDINAIDRYGQTAIMIAAGRGSISIINEILRYKPNLRIKAKSGATAYDFAFENGHKEIAKLLK